VRELSIDDIDLLDVLQPCRPDAGAQTLDAAEDLGQPLEHHQRTCDGDHRFEVIYGRTVRRNIRMLRDAPGVGGIAIPCVDEPDDARDEE
jgi:hypothetical protein